MYYKDVPGDLKPTHERKISHENCQGRAFSHFYCVQSMRVCQTVRNVLYLTAVFHAINRGVNEGASLFMSGSYAPARCGLPRISVQINIAHTALQYKFA